MNKQLIRCILKLVVIIFLLNAFLTQYDYPSLLLRLTVFCISFYLIFKVIKTRNHPAIFIYGIIAILFNPFYQLPFGRYAFKIIELVVAIGFIIFLDLKGYKDTLSQKGKILYNLIKHCIIICSVVFGLLWIFSNKLTNPYYTYLLLTESSIAKGQIIGSSEVRNDAEDSEAYDVYFVYTFKTKYGKTIKDHSSITTTESGVLSEANVKPIPIEVKYIPNDPKINRIKGWTLQPITMAEFIWRYIFLEGLIFISIIYAVFYSIRKEIRDYRIAINIIKTKEIIAQDE